MPILNYKDVSAASQVSGQMVFPSEKYFFSETLSKNCLPSISAYFAQNLNLPPFF